jgi:hypothetical protein
LLVGKLYCPFDGEHSRAHGQARFLEVGPAEKARLGRERRILGKRIASKAFEGGEHSRLRYYKGATPTDFDECPVRRGKAGVEEKLVKGGAALEYVYGLFGIGLPIAQSECSVFTDTRR